MNAYSAVVSIGHVPHAYLHIKFYLSSLCLPTTTLSQNLTAATVSSREPTKYLSTISSLLSTDENIYQKAKRLKEELRRKRLK